MSSEELCFFGKLVSEFHEQEFSLRGVKSKKISNHPGREQYTRYS